MFDKSEQLPTVPESERPTGEQKVMEYTQRVQEGESLNKIFDGLPPSFKSGIVEALLTDPTTPEEIRVRLEELGYTADLSGQQEVPDDLYRTEDVVPAAKGDILESAESKKAYELLPVEEREKLSGWQASFELAKVAHNEGVDLTALSREEYANYAVENGLAIDDDQLRLDISHRVMTSLEDYKTTRNELRSAIPRSQGMLFDQFRTMTMRQAESDKRYIQEGIRVRQGTKDSNSWLFFGINGSLPETRVETPKGYLTFNDLSTFTPERFTAFLEVLQKAGYNGDVKVFQDLEEQGAVLNDQIVMHGATNEDVELANDMAREFFGTELVTIGTGIDKNINGKEYSHSQLLAADIKRRIEERKGKNGGQ